MTYRIDYMCPFSAGVETISVTCATVRKLEGTDREFEADGTIFETEGDILRITGELSEEIHNA